MNFLSPFHKKDPFEELLCGTYIFVEPVWACRLFHTVKLQHIPLLGLHIGIIPRQPIPSRLGFHCSRKAYPMLR